jgi:hypothetical protein
MRNRDDLLTAIATCRSSGVRMYADAGINHFSGGGNDVNPYHRNPNAGCSTWGTKNSSLNINNQNNAISTSGPSSYYTQVREILMIFVLYLLLSIFSSLEFCLYRRLLYREASNTWISCSWFIKCWFSLWWVIRLVFVFVVVLFFPRYFLLSFSFLSYFFTSLSLQTERPLNSWNDTLQLNAGWLSGLTDVNTERDYVRERIADYFTDLISIGFSGFRIEAANHISPDILVVILTKFRNNLDGSLPDDFITWLEILLGGESDLLMCNENSG